MPRKIISVPPLCRILRENNTTIFEIDRDSPSEQIDVWWDRSARTDIEILMIRQEAVPGAAMADVLMLTQAQAYALIDALNRAMMDR